jgi:nitroreductase
LPENLLSKLFKGPAGHVQPSLLEALLSELTRIRQLYELDLASRGLTLDTGALEGAVYDTDEEFLEEQERKEHVRTAYGLPAGYPLGAAIPRVDPRTGKETLPEEEGAWPTPFEAGSAPESPFHTATLFIGPEGAEDPKE